MKEKFILVSDEFVAENLLKQGYTLVNTSTSNNGRMYTFINKGTLIFTDDIAKNKIVYSNMLTF
jgi:hypothetical protein